MITEYIFTFDKSAKICVTISGFTSLINSHSEIEVKNEEISFRGNSFPLGIATGHLPDGAIYFDLSIECVDEKNIDAFDELTRELRLVVGRSTKRSPLVVYDGVGEHYCKSAYPSIYKIENQMRKLITKFMLIGIGVNWSHDSIPKDVMSTLSAEGKKNQENILYEFDFIQLSNIIFKEYSNGDGNAFLKSIKGKIDDDVIKIFDIKKYIPLTNWEKYFASKINVDAQYLSAKWSKLYEYRCKIAHSRSISKSEYSDLVLICEEIGGYIQTALNSLNDLHISKIDRELVAENISSESSETISSYIAAYNRMAGIIRDICEITSSPGDKFNLHETNKTNLSMQIRYLANNKGILKREFIETVIDAQRFRNHVVHDFGMETISMDKIKSHIQSAVKITSMLLSFKEDELINLKGVDLSNNPPNK